MRLPFGLGRRSSSGDGASGGGSSTGSAPTVARSAAPVAPSRAWASLPPIQRTAGSMPLVAAPSAFVGELPGSNALPPIVQALGHEVSALATPGLVVARTRPVEVGGSRSIPSPVQRRANRGARSGPAASEVSAPAFAAEPEVVEHVHETAPAPVAAPSAPIRSMPTVSRQSIRVPDRPLTSAAIAARPAPVQRAAAPAAAEAPAAAAAAATPAPRATGSGMRRVPSGMPVVSPTVSRQASASQPAASHSPAVAAPAPSRSGLGEPMTSLPASARPVASPGPVISRSTTAGPMPIAASNLRAPIQRTAGGDGAAAQLALASGGPGTGSAPSSSASLSELPFLPVAGRAGATSSVGAATTPSVQTSAASAGPHIRPLLGANPIHTSIALQREADDDGDDESGTDAALPSPWWDSGDASARPAASGLVAMDGGGASVQRSRAEVGSGPAGATDGSPTGQARASSGRAPVQRIAATAGRSSQSMAPLPAPIGQGTRAGSNSEAWQAGHAAGSQAAASPSVQTSLVQSAPPLAASFGSPGSSPSVQRAETTAAVKSEVPTPPAPGTGPAGAGGPTPPGGQATSAHSEKDLDELAQALFGRIRGRLRSDLIYDREAKGLTFDNV